LVHILNPIYKKIKLAGCEIFVDRTVSILHTNNHKEKINLFYDKDKQYRLLISNTD